MSVINNKMKLYLVRWKETESYGFTGDTIFNGLEEIKDRTYLKINKGDNYIIGTDIIDAIDQFDKFGGGIVSIEYVGEVILPLGE